MGEDGERSAVRGGMGGLDPTVDTAQNYLRFAEREAAGRSPAYESLARAVAGDEVVLRFLASLPTDKRQPNLLFAAARYLLSDVPIGESLRKLVLESCDPLREVMLQRRTQTNEAARCATLLPALARLPQSLALIEVGASAGLALLPDRYSYDYDGHHINGLDPVAPTLRCSIEGPVPVPTAVPPVIWRRGLDLNPLDLASGADIQWLECLVWPGQQDRADRLRAAVAAARRDPPIVQRGDLVDDLAGLVAEAPREAGTVVVFHSAVLAYVDAVKRAAFARVIDQLGVHWLSHEAPAILPLTAGDDGPGFRLVENGSEVLAHTDPHGSWVRWVAGDE